jgi:hypothetical protein
MKTEDWGLIAESKGHCDAQDWDRQVKGSGALSK